MEPPVCRRFTTLSWLKTRTKIDRVIGAVHAARTLRDIQQQQVCAMLRKVGLVGRSVGRRVGLEGGDDEGVEHVYSRRVASIGRESPGAN